MNNLEEIKSQLADLTSKINKIGSMVMEMEDTQTVVDYVFTKEQMYKFVSDLHDGFLEGTHLNLTSHFEADTDCVDLDLCGNEIIVEINNRSIIDGVISCIDDNSDLDKESVEATVNEIYKNLQR